MNEDRRLALPQFDVVNAQIWFDVDESVEIGTLGHAEAPSEHSHDLRSEDRPLHDIALESDLPGHCGDVRRESSWRAGRATPSSRPTTVKSARLIVAGQRRDLLARVDEERCPCPSNTNFMVTPRLPRPFTLC